MVSVASGQALAASHQAAQKSARKSARKTSSQSHGPLRTRVCLTPSFSARYRFYHNICDGQTTWERPLTGAIFKKDKDAKGRPYWIDCRNKKSFWRKPAEYANAEKLASLRIQ